MATITTKDGGWRTFNFQSTSWVAYPLPFKRVGRSWLEFFLRNN
jgi:hypothetical protein